MKTLLPILLIISTSLFNQKGKYIVIKTDIKNLKREDVGVYESKDIYTQEKYYYKKYHIEDVIKGEVILENYSGDTAIIEIGHNIPIVIYGLQSIKSDTIILSDLKLTQYVSIDSSLTVISKSVKNRPGKYHIKERRYIPLGSSVIVAENIFIKINDRPYPFELESEPYNLVSYYCTPGKISYSIKAYGIRKYYTIKL